MRGQRLITLAVSCESRIRSSAACSFGRAAPPGESDISPLNFVTK
jgi:hypothetical protein